MWEVVNWNLFFTRLTVRIYLTFWNLLLPWLHKTKMADWQMVLQTSKTDLKFLKKRQLWHLCLAGQPCSFTKYTYIANYLCYLSVLSFWFKVMSSCWSLMFLCYLSSMRSVFDWFNFTKYTSMANTSCICVIYQFYHFSPSVKCPGAGCRSWCFRYDFRLYFLLQLTYLYKSMFSLLLYKDLHISLTLWKLTAKTLLHLNIFFPTCTFCSRIASWTNTSQYHYL